MLYLGVIEQRKNEVINQYVSLMHEDGQAPEDMGGTAEVNFGPTFAFPPSASALHSLRLPPPLVSDSRRRLMGGAALAGAALRGAHARAHQLLVSLPSIVLVESNAKC